MLLEEGYEINRDGVARTLNLGTKTGLFEKVGTNFYKLTVRGCACKSLVFFRKDVYYDVIHYLMFASWVLNNHTDYWSWSYRKICEEFWRSRPERTSSKEIFGEIMAEAAEAFPTSKPAAGTETVDKVVEFIQDLDPPFFIENNKGELVSSNRDWFSIELALLATYYLYVKLGLELSSPILIDDSIIKMISPLCLASQSTILQAIDMASKTFPYLTIHSGEWGSSLILNREVDIQLIV